MEPRKQNTMTDQSPLRLIASSLQVRCGNWLTGTTSRSNFSGEEGVNVSAEGTDRDLFDGTFESDDGRWAVVSLAGGPRCNRPEAGDAAGRKDSKADFELPACRGSGRRLGRDSPRRSSADPGLGGRRLSHKNKRWQAHYALVGEFPSGRSPAISNGEEHGRRPCTCRKR